MSVVNQMLRDLDRRRASGVERRALPRELRAAAPLRSRWPLALAAAALLTTTAFTGFRLLGDAAAPVPAQPMPVPSLEAPAEAAVSVPQVAAPPLPQPVPKASEPVTAVAEAVPAPESAKQAVPVSRERPLSRAAPRSRSAAPEEAPLKASLALAAPLAQPAETAVAAREEVVLEKRLPAENRRPETAAERLAQAMAAARRQMERNDAAGALATLEPLAAPGAANAEYRGLLAAVLQRNARQGEAIAEYRAALRLLPGAALWWLGLALSLEAEGRAAEARDAYVRARDGEGLSAELAAYVDQKLKQAP